MTRKLELNERKLSGKRRSAYKSLYNYVIKSSVPDVIPSTSLPIRVALQVGILNIHGVDRERGEIDCTRWHIWSWESHITWNPEDYEGIKSISVPLKKIWYPDLHEYNIVTGELEMLGLRQVTMHNGTHRIWFTERSSIYCDNLAEDKCSIKVLSWGQRNTLMALNDPSEFIDFNSAYDKFYFPASRYKVTSSSYEKTSISVSTSIPDIVDVIEYRFSFKEKSPSAPKGPFQAIFQWN